MIYFANNKNRVVHIEDEDLIELINSSPSRISLSVKLNTSVEEVDRILDLIEYLKPDIKDSIENFDRWTPEEDFILKKEVNEDISIEEIGKYHNRDVETIKERIELLSVDKQETSKVNYIIENELKIKDFSKKAGIFLIRYRNNKDDVKLYYNLENHIDNISENSDIFEELFLLDKLKFSFKFDFLMIDKLDYVPGLLNQVKNESQTNDINQNEYQIKKATELNRVHKDNYLVNPNDQSKRSSENNNNGLDEFKSVCVHIIEGYKCLLNHYVTCGRTNLVLYLLGSKSSNILRYNACNEFSYGYYKKSKYNKEILLKVLDFLIENKVFKLNYGMYPVLYITNDLSIISEDKLILAAKELKFID